MESLKNISEFEAERSILSSISMVGQPVQSLAGVAGTPLRKVLRLNDPSSQFESESDSRNRANLASGELRSQAIQISIENNCDDPLALLCLTVASQLCLTPRNETETNWLLSRQGFLIRATGQMFWHLTPTSRSMKTKRVPTCKEEQPQKGADFSSSKEDGVVPTGFYSSGKL